MTLAIFMTFFTKSFLTLDFIKWLIGFLLGGAIGIFLGGKV